MAMVGNQLGMGNGSGRRKMNPTSTVDAVDDGFKLCSHTQSVLNLTTCQPNYKNKNSILF